jgi:hypothetical protein
MGDETDRATVVARHRILYERWRRAATARQWASEAPAYAALRAYERAHDLPRASALCWDRAYLGELGRWPEGFAYIYPGSDVFEDVSGDVL